MYNLGKQSNKITEKDRFKWLGQSTCVCNAYCCFIAGNTNTRRVQDAFYPRCPHRISVTKTIMNIKNQFRRSSLHYGTYNKKVAISEGDVDYSWAVLALISTLLILHVSYYKISLTPPMTHEHQGISFIFRGNGCIKSFYTKKAA